MARILVVDDEPTLVRTLKFSLEREGYDVLTASDGEQALEAARKGTPNLILLDVMLRGLDGYEVCRVLRRETSVPIIMLTARTGEADKIVGLELGADDYVTKPFSMKELVARVRARLRRPETEASRQLLSAGSLRVDLTRREVTRDGKIIPLKPKEFDLLVFMMRNRGRVLSRNQLLQGGVALRRVRPDADGGRPHRAAAGQAGVGPGFNCLDTDGAGCGIPVFRMTGVTERTDPR